MTPLPHVRRAVTAIPPAGQGLAAPSPPPSPGVTGTPQGAGASPRAPFESGTAPGVAAGVEQLLPPDAQGLQVGRVDFGSPGRVLGPGERLQLPRTCGAVGVAVTTRAGNVQARVGDTLLPTWTGAPSAGFQPLHGSVELTAGPSGATLERADVFQRVPTATETTDFYPLGLTVRAGESVDVPLSRYRGKLGVEQIESMWTASYSVPDPSGRKSDEGNPYYLDGVYCEIFLVGADGTERQVDRRRFVDANEVDNAHDLPGLRGDVLRFKFANAYPEGAGHPVTFRGVRVRYQPDPTSGTERLRVDLGKTVPPGERLEVDVPPELRDRVLGRVDVRWTDMLSGTWLQPGHAVGTLLVDGRRVGPSESVQSPETQSFTFLHGAKATDGKVGVLIERDDARIDWMELFFEK